MEAPSASSQIPRENQFRVALHTDERVGIPEHVVLRFPSKLVAFLLADVSPDFIHFYVTDANVLDLFSGELLASEDEQRQMVSR